MKKIGFLLAAASLALTACSGFSNRTAIDALNEAKPVGSTFTQKLAAGYKEFSNSQQNRYFDYADALHFAKKGLMAAEGKNVMPEPLTNWQLDPGGHAELADARSRLISALDNGGRNAKPNEAALAQLKFDCWIEQQEENLIRTPSCKAEFENAMQSLSGLIKGTRPNSVKEGMIVPPPKKPLPPINNTTGKNGTVPPLASVVSQQGAATSNRIMDEGMFLVFYDFNKAVLNDSGLQVMDAVAKQLKTRKDIHAVTITGFTDTSGGTKYNQRLSQRRADAVKKALIKAGVPANLLKTKALGETQLMVKTPDNTREPANRRAEIHFD